MMHFRLQVGYDLLMVKRTTQLLKAMRQKQVVRFHTKWEYLWIHGVVLDIGPEFFVLASLNDGVEPDGYSCYHKKYIEDLEIDPHGDFVRAVLEKRKMKIAESVHVSLRNRSEMMLSAGKAFPLVSIHREEVRSHVCHIGKVIHCNKSLVFLQEIAPGAIWNETIASYPLAEITRVNFGGGYEDALHLAGGTAPKLSAQ